MKYILIGDIHGRTNWKQIVEKEKDADKFIFFGDYFDPYDWSLSLNEIVNNFNDIVEFKNKNPNKVILLIGNHDLRSWDQNANQCRYIDGTYEQVAPTLFNGILDGLFQLCYFINDNIVCSHAGFSKTWLSNNGLNLNESELNNHFKIQVENKTSTFIYDFTYGKGDVWPDTSGDNIWQSPMWIRPMSLLRDNPEGIFQCVGHTRIKKSHLQRDHRILLCDCLEHGEYYSYEDDKFKFNKI